MVHEGDPGYTRRSCFPIGTRIRPDGSVVLPDGEVIVPDQEDSLRETIKNQFEVLNSGEPLIRNDFSEQPPDVHHSDEQGKG